MEALRRAGLDAQKENVDADLVSKMGLTGADRSAATPPTKRAAFAIHTDVRSSKKGLKESAKKNRRVLGDISNKHVNRQENSGGKGVSIKKSGLQARTPNPKKARAVTAITAIPSGKHAAKHVEDIETAYGGLPSPLSGGRSMKEVRDEMTREIQSTKVPLFFDDEDNAPDVYNALDFTAEKAMLETGAAPSEWWSPPSPLPLNDEPETYDDVPPPEDFADDPVIDLVDQDLLDEALNVDLGAGDDE